MVTGPVKISRFCADRAFFQLARGDEGREVVLGEFESMKALYNFATDLNIFPKPLAYGSLEKDPDCHFFMSEFVDMVHDLPDMVDFCHGIATVHNRSMASGLSTHFGFPVTTYCGRIRQDNTWTPSWEAFYASALRQLIDDEREVHGQSDEMDELCKQIFDKVIPRLLRPLETEGRSIQPTLVHGDLWHGVSRSIVNVGMDRQCWNG